MAELIKGATSRCASPVLEFLDTDVFSISMEGRGSFLDPVTEFWDIDLRTFALEIGLNRRLAPQSIRRFEFAEKQLTERAVSLRWKNFSGTPP